jgi:uncharacterized protein YfaS (alpha-2-macroglobulin family)
MMRLAPVCLLALLLMGAAPSKNGETVYATALVNVNGPNPYRGAPVTFTFYKPNGGTIILQAVTGADGKATVSYTLKKTDPVGTWRIESSSTVGTISNKGATTFTVY